MVKAHVFALSKGLLIPPTPSLFTSNAPPQFLFLWQSNESGLFFPIIFIYEIQVVMMIIEKERDYCSANISYFSYSGSQCMFWLSHMCLTSSLPNKGIVFSQALNDASFSTLTLSLHWSFFFKWVFSGHLWSRFLFLLLFLFMWLFSCYDYKTMEKDEVPWICGRFSVKIQHSPINLLALCWSKGCGSNSRKPIRWGVVFVLGVFWGGCMVTFSTNVSQFSYPLAPCPKLTFHKILWGWLC